MCEIIERKKIKPQQHCKLKYRHVCVLQSSLERPNKIYPKNRSFSLSPFSIVIDFLWRLGICDVVGVWPGKKGELVKMMAIAYKAKKITRRCRCLQCCCLHCRCLQEA